MLHIIDAGLLTRLTAEARASDRGRRNFNFHRPEESIQRMLQAFEPKTYLAPHRHENPDKLEIFLCLRGRVALLAFTDDGTVAEVRFLQPGGPAPGAEVPPGVWHSLVSLEPGTVIYEVLDGPYVPGTGITFAPWAPAECSPEAPAYRERLRQEALRRAGAPHAGGHLLRPVDADTLDQISARAAASPRRRANHNYHRLDEPIQRMLNALEPDTCVTPHKHEEPDKREAFLCLRGRVALLSYAEDGTLVEVCRMAADGPEYGGEVPPRTWHALVGLEPGSVVYEVKDGPYDPATDKRFAPWAPAENSPEAATYREGLRALVAEFERQAPTGDAVIEPLEACREAIEEGLMADAEEAAARVVALASEWAERSPSPQLALLLEGEEHAAAARWQEAEAAYRQAVAAATSVHHELQPRWHLADLHRARARHHVALRESRAATAAARRTRWGTVIAMALLKEAGCAMAAGELAEALAAVDEALDLVDGNPYQDLLHGRILTIRAACLVERGELEDAEEDLVGARAAIEARPDPSHFAGMQRGLAYWWMSMARLRAAHGETRGAIEAQRAAVRHWRWVAALPHTAAAIPRERMAHAIHLLGELLAAAGDTAGSEAALAENQGIRRELRLPEE